MFCLNQQLPGCSEILDEIVAQNRTNLPSVAATLPMLNGMLACSASSLGCEGLPMPNPDGFGNAVPLGNIAMMDVELPLPPPYRSRFNLSVQPIGGISGISTEYAKYVLERSAHSLHVAIAPQASDNSASVQLRFSDPYGVDIDFLETTRPTTAAACGIMQVLDVCLAKSLSALRV